MPGWSKDAAVGMYNMYWSLGSHKKSTSISTFFPQTQIIDNDCLKCCVEEDSEERVLGLISNICHILQMEDGRCIRLTYCLKSFTFSFSAHCCMTCSISCGRSICLISLILDSIIFRVLANGLWTDVTHVMFEHVNLHFLVSLCH